MSTMVESLKTVPLFADLPARELKMLAESMKEHSFPAGHEIVSEGRGGVGFFVIFEGTARVSQGGEERGTLKAGDYFGETALIDNNDRTASVTAETDVRCATMATWNFRPFVRENPEVAWALLIALAKRLRDAQVPRVTS
jgi:CRP-like cAMP-binding protein